MKISSPYTHDVNRTAFPTLLWLLGNTSLQLNYFTSSFYGRVVKKVIFTVFLSCFCSCSLVLFLFGYSSSFFLFPLVSQLSCSWVPWALFSPSSDGYSFPCSFSSEVPSLYKHFLRNLITASYFRITWELYLRVFHYYFIAQCQASQLQTQMKRSFSCIFKHSFTRQWYLWSQVIRQQIHGITLSGVLNNCLELVISYIFRINYCKRGS